MGPGAIGGPDRKLVRFGSTSHAFDHADQLIASFNPPSGGTGGFGAHGMGVTTDGRWAVVFAVNSYDKLLRVQVQELP